MINMVNDSISARNLAFLKFIYWQPKQCFPEQQLKIFDIVNDV